MGVDGRTYFLQVSILIEDVNQAQGDEYIRLLRTAGTEIELTLSDGLDYVGTVQ